MNTQFIRYGNFSPTNIGNATHISFIPDGGQSELCLISTIRFDYGTNMISTWQRRIERCYENVGKEQGFKIVITDITTSVNGSVLTKVIKEFINTQEVLNKKVEEKMKEMEMLFKALEDTYTTAIPFIKQ